jgi:hypothetical protein
VALPISPSTTNAMIPVQILCLFTQPTMTPFHAGP